MEWGNVLTTTVENFVELLPYVDIQDHQQGVPYIQGKAGPTIKKPGRYWHLPFFEEIYVIDTSVRTTVFPESITLNPYEDDSSATGLAKVLRRHPTLKGSIEWRVTDAHNYFVNVSGAGEDEEDGSGVIIGRAMSVLREKMEVYAAEPDVEEVVAEALEEVNSQITKENWGLKVLKYNINQRSSISAIRLDQD